MSNIATYQGGLMPLYTRGPIGGQRGSGFFSSLKRFLIPIGKAVLPSLFRGASDLISGRPLAETAKSRGLEAGKRAIGALANSVFNNDNTTTPNATATSRKAAAAAGKRRQTSRKHQHGRGGGSELITKFTNRGGGGCVGGNPPYPAETWHEIVEESKRYKRKRKPPVEDISWQ